MRPLVWFSEEALQEAGNLLASGALTPGVTGTLVRSEDELVDGGVLFVDRGTLAKSTTFDGPVVAVATEPMPQTIPWLVGHPSLAHVISKGMLEHAFAPLHVGNVLATLRTPHPRLLDWIDRTVEGRRVRLSHASRRSDRLERMTEFFAEKNVGQRTIEHLRDAAEELLTNAFYDAPVAAGVFDEPVSREFDVALPDKYACDLAYGAADGLAIVRVKDPFGSLTRDRLVEVLTRCSKSGMQVQVDESMGGAGLGMWRIFSVASFVAISVVEHKHTEVLVGIMTKRSSLRPFAYHLFFSKGERPRLWKLARDESVRPSLNKSVLLELNSK